MGAIKPVSPSALHRLDAALEEQRTELILLRQTLKSLQDEMTALGRNMSEFDTRLTRAAAATDVLRRRNEKTIAEIDGKTR